jgi:hypothetical protein
MTAMVTTAKLAAGMVEIVAKARAMKMIMNAHMLDMLVEIHQLMKTLWILDWRIAI